jgi:hypothetical protein
MGWGGDKGKKEKKEAFIVHFILIIIHCFVAFNERVSTHLRKLLCFNVSLRYKLYVLVRLFISLVIYGKKCPCIFRKYRARNNNDAANEINKTYLNP